MNQIKQFLVDSIALDFAAKLETLSFEAQQTVTLKLAEMYLMFGETQKAHDIVVTLRTTEAKLLEAQIYATKGHVEQAAYTYFKAFVDQQQPAIYTQLAALFDEAGYEEDATYYAQLAEKLTAYQALQHLTDDEAARQQATQMIAHPQSFDGWLQSVIRLNEEQLAQYAEQAIVPIIEEKRPVRKPTLTVPAAVKMAEQHEDVTREELPTEEPSTPTYVEAPSLTRPLAAQPMMQPPVQQTAQPSPYVDPVAFIASQRATDEQSGQKEQDDDLNDFESMYFGEMYDED